MKTLLTFLVLSTIMLCTDIAMLGIKIGAPESDLENLKLEEVARDPGMVKYRTANGNDFSVTTLDGKVVFMENDWLQDPAAKQALLPGFIFGETTLSDIRKRFGSNGFAFESGAFSRTETHLILFNCYEFDSGDKEILVVITKVSLDADVNEENLAHHAKLEALIVAAPNYLDEIWGAEKAYDPANKKIKL